MKLQQGDPDKIADKNDDGDQHAGDRHIAGQEQQPVQHKIFEVGSDKVYIKDILHIKNSFLRHYMKTQHLVVMFII